MDGYINANINLGKHNILWNNRKS